MSAKLEGKIMIEEDEIGTFSVGFDDVIMMDMNGGRWSPTWVFDWAREHHKKIELVF